MDPTSFGRLGLWVISTTMGSVGVVALWASFFDKTPISAVTAVLLLGGATAIEVLML